MATPESIHCIGCAMDHLETEESLRFHWQHSCKIEISVWMDFSLLETTAAISLQSIQAIKKEGKMNIAKALSIPRWKDGKNIPPTKERHDNFQLQAFQCVILYLQTKLKPKYLPQTYGDGILPWPQISLVGVATPDWPEMGICG